MYLASCHVREGSNNGILLILGEPRASSRQFNPLSQKHKGQTPETCRNTLQTNLNATKYNRITIAVPDQRERCNTEPDPHRQGAKVWAATSYLPQYPYPRLSTMYDPAVSLPRL